MINVTKKKLDLAVAEEIISQEQSDRFFDFSSHAIKGVAGRKNNIVGVSSNFYGRKKTWWR